MALTLLPPDARSGGKWLVWLPHRSAAGRARTLRTLASCSLTLRRPTLRGWWAGVSKSCAGAGDAIVSRCEREGGSC
eukprot:6201179-Pleurochrysis_carterae.AAC.1